MHFENLTLCNITIYLYNHYDDDPEFIFRLSSNAKNIIKKKPPNKKNKHNAE